ncbi:DUF1697 domain-containing protein [Solicola gregarius]|uniref:DUF1697 domain-containing protein n=1 Tax=Solicola gregarius TaxID=2908642 RepID=A0AA46TLD4_9ACTN|nr:DUF1697 domain-containing protein [Solicola gregarius]UYM07220.1 DUF1697 domain-containing protein [Solicola gregarius]
MPVERVAILLRAVNVGGYNKVPMAELRTLCGRLGLREVTTYVASGNIACAAPPDLDATLRQVEAAIADEFGVETPAIGRTHTDLETAVANNPYTGFEPKLMHVVYLAGEADPDGASALCERDFGDDECTVIGREVYARYATGVQGSKLTPLVMQKLLGVPGTARNWRTAQKLVELTT